MSTDHGTYAIKTGGRPAGSPAKYNFSLIQTLLEATNPSKVSSAGEAFTTAAQAAAHAAHELYKVGTTLAGEWQGADADSAQKALGQLYATANELYWRSQQAGQALQTYGSALPQYKGLQWPPGGASPVEDEARQKAAEKVMQAVNQQIGAAWDSMPDKVQQNLPDLAKRNDGEPYSPGSSPLRSHGVSGGAGGSSGHVKPPHIPKYVGKGLAGDDGGQGVQLASMPSAGGGLDTTPPPTGPFIPGAGGPPPIPGGSAPGGFSVPPLTGLSLPSNVASPEKTPVTVRDDPSAASSSPVEEIETAQAARGGTLGGPGGFGAGGTRDVERERSTWLTEEEDIWNGGEESVPHVLGETAPHGDATDREAAYERLNEDRDVWTGEEAYAPERIGDTRPQSDEAQETAIVESDNADVLDPERLQEMLDALIEPPEEQIGDATSASDEFAALLDDLGIEDVSLIDRPGNE